MSDAEFVQVVCALRLCLPTVGISLSTRESPALRDGVFRLGVTSMSAGSHTEPGGYAEPSEADRQFEIADTRSPTEVASMLRAAGYDPVWKDTIGAREVAVTRRSLACPVRHVPLGVLGHLGALVPGQPAPQVLGQS